MLTKDQALDELAKLQATGKVTTKKLMELAAQVSLDATPGFTQGSVTVLYSGTINGVSSTDYIGEMIRQNADIRVIDKTHVGQFLADKKFNDAWKLAGGTPTELYHGSNGPWAKASERFVAATVGEVRLLALAPASDSVFVKTELKAILDGKTGITSIEGVSVADLKKMRFGDALKSVTMASAENVGYSGFKIESNTLYNPDGSVQRDRRGNVRKQLTSLAVGDFLKREILDTPEYIKNNPKALENFKDFMKSGITETEAGWIKTGARGVMKRLGGIGSALVLGMALSESAAAAESGDTEGARKIMESWALDAAGGAAGAAIGSAVVAIAAGAAVAAGAVISAPVLAAPLVRATGREGDHASARTCPGRSSDGRSGRRFAKVETLWATSAMRSPFAPHSNRRPSGVGGDTGAVCLAPLRCQTDPQPTPIPHPSGNSDRSAPVPGDDARRYTRNAASLVPRQAPARHLYRAPARCPLPAAPSESFAHEP
jgi:hypothetical protein